MNDVRKHLSTVKHKEMMKATSGTKTLSTFFQQSSIEQSVTRAEVLFANFVAEHNLPFMVADHFTHLVPAIFPDSNVARAFRCASTKTTCVVKGALHPQFADPIVATCQTSPISILCDESSDTDRKSFAILVRFWDERVGKPMTRFLAMPLCKGGSGAYLFGLIDAELEERNIVAFESDTANLMIGKHNSVLSPC